MGIESASTPDFLVPWGGDVAISQENDLITSVKGDEDRCITEHHEGH